MIEARKVETVTKTARYDLDKYCDHEQTRGVGDGE
jgi:hypothetical protein